MIQFHIARFTNSQINNDLKKIKYKYLLNLVGIALFLYRSILIMKELILRTYFSIMGNLFPTRTAFQALKLFATPRKRREFKGASEVLFEVAVKSHVLHDGKKVSTYVWGEGSKTAFLIHGWESRALDFHKVIKQLIDQDYQVYSFDGLAHGLSEGEITNIVEFKNVIKTVVTHFQITKIDLVLGHSMGGAAGSIAMNELEVSINKMVLLSIPGNLEKIVERFVDFIALPEKSAGLLHDLIENHFQVPLDELNNKLLFAPQVNDQLLLVHDLHDEVCPIEDLTRVAKAWEIPVQKATGTEHNTIIKDDQVLEKYVLN